MSLNIDQIRNYSRGGSLAIADEKGVFDWKARGTPPLEVHQWSPTLALLAPELLDVVALAAQDMV